MSIFTNKYMFTRESRSVKATAVKIEDAGIRRAFEKRSRSEKRGNFISAQWIAFVQRTNGFLSTKDALAQRSKVREILELRETFKLDLTAHHLFLSFFFLFFLRRSHSDCGSTSLNFVGKICSVHRHKQKTFAN